MADKEVLTGNKSIAFFMGATKSKIDGGSRFLRFPEPHAGTKTYAFYPHNLKYHTSWDWLKPVVDKIYKIYDEESDNWPVTPLYGDVYDPYIFFDLRITESINSVYRHVIAFINFYNQTYKQ